MIEDPVLLNDWYIVAATRDLTESEMLTARLWDDGVAWLEAAGAQAGGDLCSGSCQRSSLFLLRPWTSNGRREDDHWPRR